MSLKKRYLRHFSAAAVLSLAFSSHALALDSLDIDKDKYTQGQYIGVSYTGVTQEEEDNQAWVAIAKPGAEAGSYLDWAYLKAGSGTCWLEVPDGTGMFEIRWYTANAAKAENLAAEPRISFLVNDAVPGDDVPVYPEINDFDWSLLDFHPSLRSWTGTYETNFKTLYLRQEGDIITGEYPEWDNGRVDGNVVDGIFFGYWYESPSYAPRSDAGQLIFAMHPDGAGFTGWWRYGNSGNWSVWTSGELNRQETSDWAQDEAYAADANHLIPDSLRSINLTEEISIAEFADLAVRLYEEVFETEAEPVETPYQDIEEHPLLTSIEKAYGLGILKPIKAETFKPDKGFGREVMARMLYNLVKACEFEDCSFETVDSYSLPYTVTVHFDDEADIQEGSLESVYYLTENRLMNEVADNRFDPDGQATREQAVIAVNRIFGLEQEKHHEDVPETEEGVSEEDMAEEDISEANMQ